jgi:peptide/nickel transport system permease protein
VRYLVTRVGQSLLVLAIMSFVIYSLLGLMPGDPIDQMISADPYMTPEDAAALRALYGLDLPVYERYWNWLLAALGGDFGYSRLYNQPVAQVLIPALENSVLLLVTALTLSSLPTGSVRRWTTG